MTSLADVSLFRTLPSHEQSWLLETCAIENLPAGTFLFCEGQSAGHFYLVLQGVVEVVKALGTEEETILGRRLVGEFVGEMGLLNPDGLRTAAVRAVEDARLMAIRYSDFTALLGRNPSLAYGLARVLSARMTEAQNETIHTLHDKNARLQEAYTALQAAQAQIIEKEKLERELQLAREIQYSILPAALPTAVGYEFGALMVPAKAVGGDFYSIFALDQERMALVVGDVTDKGIPAALFMAQTHALLRAAASAELNPAQVLERVNAFLLEMNRSGLFVTVIYGVLHLPSGEFVYARAGHELPVLLDAHGQVGIAAAGKGAPLGILDEPQFELQQLSLLPGEGLFLYTDGVTDCSNLYGQRFEQAGFSAALQALDPDLTAQAACDAVFTALSAFQGEAVQFDDITLLAVHRCLPAEDTPLAIL